VRYPSYLDDFCVRDGRKGCVYVLPTSNYITNVIFRLSSIEQKDAETASYSFDVAVEVRQNSRGPIIDS